MKINGRVVQKNEKSLTLLSQGKWRQVKFKSSEAIKSINPGDIVSCHSKGCDILFSTQKERNNWLKQEDILIAQKWMLFEETIRDFFKKNKFIELKTPTLVESPGLEPFLDVFKTEFVMGQKKKTYYLPTSPEFHLKKALCRGFENIFEMKPVFRNGEISIHHQPEFMMLEWYRAYSETKEMMNDVKNLLLFVSKKFKKKMAKIQTLKMEDLWKKTVGFSLTPKTTAQELYKLCQKLSINESHVTPQTSFDDLFHLIWISRIDPWLAKQKAPLIIWHFPPSQAALAKLTPEGWADRFEVYWKGLEMANAFNELNDPKEQRRRFQIDQNKKRNLGKEIVPIDENFMEHLEWGMPPSVGIALGVERLFMALFEIENINQLKLFPITSY